MSQRLIVIVFVFMQKTHEQSSSDIAYCYISLVASQLHTAQNMREVSPQKLPHLGRAFTDVQEMRQVSSKKLVGGSEQE